MRIRKLITLAILGLFVTLVAINSTPAADKKTLRYGRPDQIFQPGPV